MIRPAWGKGGGKPRDARSEMIAETNAFLSWALRQKNGMPRIPRRRVQDGGFKMLLRQPGAKAAIGRWWDTMLDKIATP